MTAISRGKRQPGHKRPPTRGEARDTKRALAIYKVIHGMGTMTATSGLVLDHVESGLPHMGHDRHICSTVIVESGTCGGGNLSGGGSGPLPTSFPERLTENEDHLSLVSREQRTFPSAKPLHLASLGDRETSMQGRLARLASSKTSPFPDGFPLHG